MRVPPSWFLGGPPPLKSMPGEFNLHMGLAGTGLVQTRAWAKDVPNQEPLPGLPEGRGRGHQAPVQPPGQRSQADRVQRGGQCRLPGPRVACSPLLRDRSLSWLPLPRRKAQQTAAGPAPAVPTPNQCGWDL